MSIHQYIDLLIRTEQKYNIIPIFYVSSVVRFVSSQSKSLVIISTNNKFPPSKISIFL